MKLPKNKRSDVVELQILKKARQAAEASTYGAYGMPPPRKFKTPQVKGGQP